MLSCLSLTSVFKKPASVLARKYHRRLERLASQAEHALSKRVCLIYKKVWAIIFVTQQMANQPQKAKTFL
jgi:hypothetical protein